MIAAEKIVSLFDQVRRKGWNFSAKPEEGWGKSTNYRGMFKNLGVFISLSREWVCLQSIIADSIGDKPREHLYESLLTLNDRMFLTKFSLDDCGRIIFLAEFPSANFDSAAFNDMLEAVERYLAKFFNKFIDSFAGQFPAFFLPQAGIEKHRKDEGARMLTNEKIKSFFMGVTKKNWFLKEQDDGSRSVKYNWSVEYRGRSKNFDVFVTFSTRWVYFQSPVMRQPVEGICKLALYEYLLRLNQRMFVGKFGLGKDNIVILSLEFPSDNFNFNLFIEGVEAMTYYLEKFSYEINILALEPEIAGLTTGKELDLPALTHPPGIIKIKKKI